MRVTVDGERRDLPEGTSLAGLLELLGEPADGRHLLVEINGRFVHPRDYAGCTLREGDRVEIVYPAFGG
ncbi:MAG: thiamine biosynthesis protein ThiS [Deltaproteobacteria bacterium]|nr:MAG: thiamine biosynthesis protein ThiS [Deltaproteobacteria bacterium]